VGRDSHLLREELQTRSFLPTKNHFDMSQKQYALPRGSCILVTAANSHIGSNIVDLLLELGFQVRGTVRADKPWLNGFFEKKYGKNRFETVVVPGAEKEGAFDDVLDDVTGIIHVVCSLHVLQQELKC
jgi:nucleoside-diphosphate-sugar epimerase